MMRKIVAITVTWVENNRETQCNWIAIAACEDGTVWQLRDKDSEWTRLPVIPTE
jgi:hypothetical protein